MLETSVTIYLEGVEDSIAYLTLADFGGVLPVVGDYVSLPIGPATEDEEADTDEFRVTARHAFPKHKDWTIDVAPITGAGFDYQRKLQKRFSRK